MAKVGAVESGRRRSLGPEYGSTKDFGECGPRSRRDGTAARASRPRKKSLKLNLGIQQKRASAEFLELAFSTQLRVAALPNFFRNLLELKELP